jgi:hypothetical protein
MFSVCAERVEADDLGILCDGGVSSSSAAPRSGLGVGKGIVAADGPSGAGAVSKRRPNSTEGSTKVRIASKGTLSRSGLSPKFSVMENPSSVTSSPSYQCWMTMVISSG